MKTYKNLYPKLCSYRNLSAAFNKARKNKGSKHYVQAFEKRLEQNLKKIKEELETFTYKPYPLTKFVIRDPKTRVIRKSIFRDRVVHHAIVNILEPIYEKIFIYDSYANRKGKGTLAALQRFDEFKRKVSRNGLPVKKALHRNMIKGYVLKADVRHFFDSVNQAKLIEILERKIKDKKLIDLIDKVLKNFDNKEKGMPLGNMTSQFFANIYLNDLDQFVKKRLKVKYYIRYVDDFVILHSDKRVLEEIKDKIEKYLKNLRLELHPDKSKITPLYQGTNLLGFKVFYDHKRVRKRNLALFYKRTKNLEKLYNEQLIGIEFVLESLEGWFGYIMWGDTYRLRKKMIKEIILKFDIKEEKMKERLNRIGKLNKKMKILKKNCIKQG